MNNVIKTTILTLGLSLTPLFAGAGHSHGEHGHNHTQKEMKKENIEHSAKQYLLQLIQEKKIDKSWEDISVSEAQKKQFGHHTEWSVSFENSQIKDKEKQILYIFVDLYGKITGANFTGK